MVHVLPPGANSMMSGLGQCFTNSCLENGWKDEWKMNEWKKVWRLRLENFSHLRHPPDSTVCSSKLTTEGSERTPSLRFPCLPLSDFQHLSAISGDPAFCISPLLFFLPPDGTMSSILKALGVHRLLFFVLLYTIRIFIFNKWVPTSKIHSVNDMCWTNSLKYYSSKMKK